MQSANNKTLNSTMPHLWRGTIFNWIRRILKMVWSRSCCVSREEGKTYSHQLDKLLPLQPKHEHIVYSYWHIVLWKILETNMKHSFNLIHDKTNEYYRICGACMHKAITILTFLTWSKKTLAKLTFGHYSFLLIYLITGICTMIYMYMIK